MKANFAEIFDAVQMDPEAKQVFLTMPREEQLLAILGMQAWMRSELVNVKKEVIGAKQDIEEFKKESRKYRAKRERMEGTEPDEETMTTTQKINRRLHAPLIWFTDKVLPQLVSLIVLAILYLTFGGKAP